MSFVAVWLTQWHWWILLLDLNVHEILVTMQLLLVKQCDILWKYTEHEKLEFFSFFFLLYNSVYTLHQCWCFPIWFLVLFWVTLLAGQLVVGPITWTRLCYQSPTGIGIEPGTRPCNHPSIGTKTCTRSMLHSLKVSDSLGSCLRLFKSLSGRMFFFVTWSILFGCTSLILHFFIRGSNFLRSYWI